MQELGRRKRKHQILVAAGCLVQRNGAEVLDRVPKVDGLLGTRRWMDVLELIGQVRGGKQRRRLERYAVLGDAAGNDVELLGGVPALLGDPTTAFTAATPRPPVTAGSAYLKISDGCNAPCAFCTIPVVQGQAAQPPAGGHRRRGRGAGR